MFSFPQTLSVDKTRGLKRNAPVPFAAKDFRDQKRGGGGVVFREMCLVLRDCGNAPRKIRKKGSHHLDEPFFGNAFADNECPDAKEFHFVSFRFFVDIRVIHYSIPGLGLFPVSLGVIPFQGPDSRRAAGLRPGAIERLCAALAARLLLGLPHRSSAERWTGTDGVLLGEGGGRGGGEGITALFSA